VGDRPADTYWRFDDCERCSGRSYIYEGRPYSPHEVLELMGGQLVPLPDELELLRNDIALLYRLTSVRYPPHDATPILPLLGQLTTAPVSTATKKRARRRVDRNGDVVLDATVTTTGRRKTSEDWTPISSSEPGYDLLDRFIYERFKPPANVLADPHGLTSLRRSRDGNTLLCGTGSTYCENKASQFPDDPAHNHSRVYFLVHRSGMIEQRCHAQKVYNGQKCSDYRSPPRYLTSELRAVLWPPVVPDEVPEAEIEAEAAADDEYDDGLALWVRLHSERLRRLLAHVEAWDGNM